MKPERKKPTKSIGFGHPLLELAAALLAALVLTFTAFYPALDAGFVSDDLNAVVDNEWVAGTPDPVGIFRHFSWWGEARSDLYRPATTLTFLWNRLAGRAQPADFRIVDFAWNALCAALLFAFARMLGLARESSLLAATLFAVLPIHSEPVIWIVGRAELGAASGFLLVAILCLLYRRGGSWLLLATASITTAVAMLFKENAVTVLAMPLIYQMTRVQMTRGQGTSPEVTGARDRRLLSRDAQAMAAIAAGAAVYAVLRHGATGPKLNLAPQSLLDNPLSVLPVGTRLLGALAVFGRYVALTFWPASLSIDYSFNGLGIGPGFVASSDTLVAVSFFAAAAAAAMRGPWRRDIVATGLLMAAAAYAIVSNTLFAIGTILGERLFYLPSAGLLIAFAAIVEPWITRKQSRARIAVIAAGALLVVAAIGVDRHRSREWQTPVTVFEAAVRTVPESARAHMELATAYGAVGRIDDAKMHFARSLAIKPDYAAAAYNLGNMLAHAGRLADAAVAYRQAVAANPRLSRAWRNLSLTERMLGHTSAWLDAIREAAKQLPNTPTLENELGEALLAAGQYAEAIPVYDALVASGKATAATYFNRGVAHHHLGGCEAALDDYRRATSAPDPPREAFQAANGCLRQLGRE